MPTTGRMAVSQSNPALVRIGPHSGARKSRHTARWLLFRSERAHATNSLLTIFRKFVVLQTDIVTRHRDAVISYDF